MLFSILFFISILRTTALVSNSVSGEYPDPLNEPFVFNSTNQTYYNLLDTPIFNRVVNARLYHNGYWVHKDAYAVTQTPNSIGSALARLKPTFVHGLLLKQPGSNFTDQEIAAFIAVRKAILATSPYCKFNMVLDAQDFLTTNARSVTNLLNELKTKMTLYPDFKIDAIHFEHWNQGYNNQSSLGNYAAQFIHGMNMLVGGNTYGGSIPPLTDYIGMTTTALKIESGIYDFNYPAIGLITNANPLDYSSEACAFLNDSNFVSASSDFDRMYSSYERQAVLQGLLDGEVDGGYSTAWPVFAPVCPSQNAYDATADGLISWIQQNGLVRDPVTASYTIPLSTKYTVTPRTRNITTTPDPQLSSVHSVHASLPLTPIFCVLVSLFPILLGFL